MRSYKNLTDEKRDQVYEYYKKNHNNYKTAYVTDVSPSSVRRIVNTAEVVKSGDENKQKEFKKTFNYVPGTWDWAQRRFAPPKEEPVQVADEKPEEDMAVTEIRELRNMLERHLTAVNTALTTILKCWGVDSNERK